jgi:2-dehydro-3-deoxyphosphogluconate aldolase / (4S)-4-hydroxy-2-oxoglutarate aldolase
VDADALLNMVPVIPVATVEDAARAVSLARALAAGGVGVIEVTLRSAAALDAIRAIAAEVPGIAAGAGTICSPAQAWAARAAGAQFLVSPGSTDSLLGALQESGLPFLAGVATPSDALRLLERGIHQAKLFPAAAAGGTALLRSLHGPFPGLRVCATGGITAESAPEYLALPNVACVGGTWLAPPSDVAAAKWPAIQQRAAESLLLGGSRSAPHKHSARGSGRVVQHGCR